MDRYIGLDAHSSSCTLGVVGPSGKRLGLHVVETNAKALIEVLRSIPGPRHLCLEEGTHQQMSWRQEYRPPFSANHCFRAAKFGIARSTRSQNSGVPKRRSCR